MSDDYTDFRSALVDANDTGETFSVVASPSTRIAALLADRDRLAAQIERFRALTELAHVSAYRNAVRAILGEKP